MGLIILSLLAAHSVNINKFIISENNNNFRLLKYDPKTKQNTVLINNLSFSNGVELADDESFLIIAETIKYQVLKYEHKNYIYYYYLC